MCCMQGRPLTQDAQILANGDHLAPQTHCARPPQSLYACLRLLWLFGKVVELLPRSLVAYLDRWAMCIQMSLEISEVHSNPFQK